MTEAATNLVKHGGGGELLLRTLGNDGTRGVGVLALDRGPGFGNLAEAMRDGFSTAGTPGTGLGAIRRLSTLFDIYSLPGAGAALWPPSGRAVPPATAPGPLVGGINVAVSGRKMCRRRLGARRRGPSAPPCSSPTGSVTASARPPPRAQP